MSASCLWFSFITHAAANSLLTRGGWLFDLGYDSHGSVSAQRLRDFPGFSGPALLPFAPADRRSGREERERQRERRPGRRVGGASGPLEPSRSSRTAVYAAVPGGLPLILDGPASVDPLHALDVGAPRKPGVNLAGQDGSQRRHSQLSMGKPLPCRRNALQPPAPSEGRARWLRLNELCRPPHITSSQVSFRSWMLTIRANRSFPMTITAYRSGPPWMPRKAVGCPELSSTGRRVR